MSTLTTRRSDVSGRPALASLLLWSLVGGVGLWLVRVATGRTPPWVAGPAWGLGGLLLGLVAVAWWARWGAPLLLRGLGRGEDRPRPAAALDPLDARALEAARVAAAACAQSAPEVWVVPHHDPNALIVRPPGRRYVLVTRGLLDRLDASELASVFTVLLTSDMLGQASWRYWGSAAQALLDLLLSPLRALVVPEPAPLAERVRHWRSGASPLGPRRLPWWPLLFLPAVPLVAAAAWVSSHWGDGADWLAADALSLEYGVDGVLLASTLRTIDGARTPTARLRAGLPQMWLVDPAPPPDGTPSVARASHPDLEVRSAHLLERSAPPPPGRSRGERGPSSLPAGQPPALEATRRDPDRFRRVAALDGLRPPGVGNLQPAPHPRPAPARRLRRY